VASVSTRELEYVSRTFTTPQLKIPRSLGSCDLQSTVYSAALWSASDYSTTQARFQSTVTLSSRACHGTPQKQAGPRTSRLSMSIHRGASGRYEALFRMPLYGDHLKGFIDHVRAFDTEFCHRRRRCPAQHQHSKKKLEPPWTLQRATHVQPT
jgi:hypothetical protein